MRRLAILIVLGVLLLGCAHPTSPKVHPQPQHTQPHNPPPQPQPTQIPINVNDTLTEVNELLNELQSVDNVSFNL